MKKTTNPAFQTNAISFALGLVLMVGALGCSGGGRVQLHMKSPDDFNPQTAHPNQIAERINNGKLGLDEGLKLLREKAAQAEISDDPVELVIHQSKSQINREEVNGFDPENKKVTVEELSHAFNQIDKGEYLKNLAVLTGISDSAESMQAPSTMKSVVNALRSGSAKKGSIYNVDAIVAMSVARKSEEIPSLRQGRDLHEYLKSRIANVRERVAHKYYDDFIVELNIKKTNSKNGEEQENKSDLSVEEMEKVHQLIGSVNGTLSDRQVEIIEDVGLSESVMPTVGNKKQVNPFSDDLVILATDAITQYGFVSFLADKSRKTERSFGLKVLNDLRFALHVADYRSKAGDSAMSEAAIGLSLPDQNYYTKATKVMGGVSRAMLFMYFDYFQNQTEDEKKRVAIPLPTTLMLRNLLASFKSISDSLVLNPKISDKLILAWQNLADIGSRAVQTSNPNELNFSRTESLDDESWEKTWFGMSDLGFYLLTRPYRQTLQSLLRDESKVNDLYEVMVAPKTAALVPQFAMVVAQMGIKWLDKMEDVRQFKVHAEDLAKVDYRPMETEASKLPVRIKNIIDYESAFSRVEAARAAIAYFTTRDGIGLKPDHEAKAIYKDVVLTELNRALAVRFKTFKIVNKENVVEFKDIIKEIKAEKTDGTLVVELNKRVELSPGIYDPEQIDVELRVRSIGFHPLAMIRNYGYNVSVQIIDSNRKSMNQREILDSWIDVSSRDSYGNKSVEVPVREPGRAHKVTTATCRLIQDSVYGRNLVSGIDHPSRILIYPHTPQWYSDPSNTEFVSESNASLTSFLTYVGSKYPKNSAGEFSEILKGEHNRDYVSYYWKDCDIFDVFEGEKALENRGKRPTKINSPSQAYASGYVDLNHQDPTQMGFPLLVALGGDGHDGFEGTDSIYCANGRYESPKRSTPEIYELQDYKSVDNDGSAWCKDKGSVMALPLSPDSRFDIPSGFGSDGGQATSGGNVYLNIASISQGFSILFPGGNGGRGGPDGSCGRGRNGDFGFYEGSNEKETPGEDAPSGDAGQILFHK